MDMDKVVGIDLGSRGLGGGRQREKNWDNYNRITIILKTKLQTKTKSNYAFVS